MLGWVALVGAALLCCASGGASRAEAADGSQKGAFGIYRQTKVLDLRIKTKTSGDTYTLEAPPSPHDYLSIYVVHTDSKGMICDVTAVGFVDKGNAYAVGSTITRQMQESYGKGQGIGENGKIAFYSNDYMSGTVSSQLISGRSTVLVSIKLKPRAGCAEEPKIPTNSFN